MKRVLKDSLRHSLFGMICLLMWSCSGRKADETDLAGVKYTCPMHPQIVTEEPGTCPICGMDLVPASSHGAHDTVAAGLEDIVKPADAFVLSEIRTVQPIEGTRVGSIEIQGIINYDTNQWNAVSSRVSGRIERLYINYNYQYVRKGQKLMDIYSPDLASAQQELLYLRRNGDKVLLEAAKTKLRVLGASDQQINAVLRSGKIDYTFSVYSPYSGYVSEQRAANSAASEMQTSGTVISGGTSMDEMGESAAPAPDRVPPVETNSPLQIREGQYFAQGQKIVDLINANSVFADFFAGTEQLHHLKRGTAIQVSSTDNPEQKVLTKVSLIQPYYSEGTTFSLLRARVTNQSQKWKVGQLITVKTDADSKFGTWLPRTAVLQSGSRFIAFAKRGTAFVPVYVSVVGRQDDWVDVGGSLDKATDVAVNAWFMVDSESFIKVDTLKR